MMGKESTSAPVRMFFLVVSLSFIIELGQRFLPLGYVEQSLSIVHAAALSLTLVPVLYFCTYRPWQKELEGRLWAQRQRDRVVELSPVIIASVTLGGSIVDVNRATERILGWTPGEVIGKRVVELVHPEDAAAVIGELGRVSFEASTVYFPCRIQCKDGSYRWIDWLGEFDAREGVVRGVGRDVTKQRKADDALRAAHQELEWRVEQRTEELLRANEGLIAETRQRAQVEQELRDSEERYRLLVECSPDAIAVHSEGMLVFANPAAMSLLGASSPEQLIGRPITESVHLNYRGTVSRRIQVMSEQGIPVQLIEEKFVRLDGTTVDVEVCSMPVDYRGQRSFVSIARDITERKKMLAALTESEGRYRTLAEAAPDMVFVVDRDGYVEYVNKRGAERMGLAQEDIIGRRHLALFPPDQAERHWMNMCKIFESGEPLQVEDWMQVGSQALWLHTSLVPVRSASGEVRAVLGVARDLTEHKRAEQALVESEARFRAIFERTTVGIAVMDMHGRILEANPTMQRILGYGREELVSLDFRAVTHPDDVVVQLPLHEELVGGKREHYQIDKRYVRKSGTIRWAHVMISLVDYGTGRFILGVVDDVTERKQALDDLARVQTEWKKLFESMHPAMVMDVEHKIIAVNHATTEVLDWPEAALVGRKCYEIFHGTAEPIAECPMERALRSKHAESEEVSLECVNGRFIVWCDPVLTETGEVERVIHIATDVTEKVEAEETLRDYETRMRAVFETLRMQGRGAVVDKVVPKNEEF